MASLIGLSLEEYGRGRMTCDLRRLRLHGLVERIPFTRRYRVTDEGLRTAMCHHRTHARVLRPAMSVAFEAPPRQAARLNRAIDSFDRESNDSGRAVALPPECNLTVNIGAAQGIQ